MPLKQAYVNTYPAYPVHTPMVFVYLLTAIITGTYEYDLHSTQ